MRAGSKEGRTLALLALLSGCIDLQGESIEIPEEVEWVALLALSPEGALRRSSGLLPSTPVPAFSFLDEADDQQVLLGFRGDSIAALAPELSEEGLEGQLAREPLHVAEGCEPRLPAPVIALERDAGGGWQTLDEAPALSFGWLAGRCEEPRPELWFGLDGCGGLWCPREIVPKDPCRFTLRYLGCRLPEFDVSVSPSGTDLCLATVGGEAQQAAAPSLPVQDAFQVDCEVFVGRREELAPRVRRWSFADLIPEIPPPPERLLGKQSTELLATGEPFGVASDLLVLERRLIVKAARGEPADCLEASTADPGFVIYDREGDELVNVRTATSSPCSYYLESMPDGRGFYAAYAITESRIAVEARDEDARVRMRRELSVDLPMIHVGGLVVVDQTLFVVVRGELEGGAEESAILRFSLEDLSPDPRGPKYFRAARPQWEFSQSFRQLRSAGRYLLSHERASQSVFIFDTEQDLTVSSARGAVGGPKIVDFEFDPVRGRVVATGRDAQRNGFSAHASLNFCFASGVGSNCDWTTIQYPDEDSFGLRLAPWPGRPDWMTSFVGVQRGTQVATLLTTINLAHEPLARYRFAAAPVSDLPVYTVRATEDALWALVPDDASVLRIQP